jgi:Excalibur calcium-binding domain
MGKLLAAAIVVAAAQGTVYPEQRPEPPPRAVEMERGERVSVPANLPAAYHCDGRQYCSQMHSCAEATWFLKNCPTIKMDGDGDGVPCERQWCN